jgi:hypothetical protein
VGYRRSWKAWSAKKSEQEAFEGLKVKIKERLDAAHLDFYTKGAKHIYTSTGNVGQNKSASKSTTFSPWCHRWAPWWMLQRPRRHPGHVQSPSGRFKDYISTPSPILPSLHTPSSAGRDGPSRCRSGPGICIRRRNTVSRPWKYKLACGGRKRQAKRSRRKLAWGSGSYWRSEGRDGSGRFYARLKIDLSRTRFVLRPKASDQPPLGATPSTLPTHPHAIGNKLVGAMVNGASSSSIMC